MAAAAAAMAVAAAMVVAAAAATLGLVAATPGLVAAASGLGGAAVAGSSLDVEVAAGSVVAAGSEVAGAAAAASLASGSMTSGGPMIGGPGGPAAHPGERAACAKSHDLAAGLTEYAVVGLEARQATAFVKYRRSLERTGKNTIASTREPFVLCDPRP